MLMDVAMTRNTCLYTPNSCWLRRRTRINGRAKFRANAAVFATRYQMVLDESDSFGFASNFIRETFLTRTTISSARRIDVAGPRAAQNIGFIKLAACAFVRTPTGSGDHWRPLAVRGARDNTVAGRIQRRTAANDEIP